MIPGDVVTISGGKFANMTATVIRDEGDEIVVEVALFGRTTEVRLERGQIADPDADPREKWRERIGKSFDLWASFLEQQWWADRDESSQEPSADEWRDFEAFRDQDIAELEAERESVLATFDVEFDDAAYEREGKRALEAVFEESAERWLKYDLEYEQVIEERKARLKQEPSYADYLQARNLRIRQRKHDVYEQYFREHVEVGDPQRREKAFAAAMERYEEIKPEFEATFGMPLPEQTARFWAFWTSLEGPEKKAADWVWRYPAGIMDWFAEGFEDRELIEGLDHRLHYRYYQAPPEFVCVMTGHSDGLNYGLWYEDPADEPTWVASFYARDDGRVSPDGRTILEAYRKQLERADENVGMDPYLSEDEILEHRCRLGLLREALCYFETADRPERGRQYLDAYAPQLHKLSRVATQDGFGVDTDRPVELPDRPQSDRDVFQAYRNQPELVQTWIEAARRQLDEGHPYPALVVGRDLHALGLEQFDQDALELMVAAYEALDRHALADIARLHHQHRDLRAVDVYTHKPL